MNEKLLKRNKELEVIFWDHNDNEVILNNYKFKLDIKNNEIDNSITKWKEIKGNLDQYEKDKENNAKEFQRKRSSTIWRCPKRIKRNKS